MENTVHISNKNEVLPNISKCLSFHHQWQERNEREKEQWIYIERETKERERERGLR